MQRDLKMDCLVNDSTVSTTSGGTVTGKVNLYFHLLGDSGVVQDHVVLDAVQL